MIPGAIETTEAMKKVVYKGGAVWVVELNHYWNNRHIDFSGRTKGWLAPSPTREWFAQNFAAFIRSGHKDTKFFSNYFHALAYKTKLEKLHPYDIATDTGVTLSKLLDKLNR